MNDRRPPRPHTIPLGRHDVADTDTPSPFSAASYAETIGMHVDREIVTGMSVRLIPPTERLPARQSRTRAQHRLARNRRMLPQLLAE